jgi:hypothetical protein
MKKLLLSLVSFFVIAEISLAQTPGVGGATGGGGGGGGGSNVYGFRYIFLSKSGYTTTTFKKDRAIDTAYTQQSDSNLLKTNISINKRSHYYSSPLNVVPKGFQYFVNDFLLWLLKVNKTDFVDRRRDTMIRKPATITGFQLMRNPCDSCKKDTVYQYSSSPPSDSMIFDPHWILYGQILPYHRLSFYILSRNQDTLMFEVWPPPRKLQNNDFNGQSTIIDGFKNADVYNWTDRAANPPIEHPADTFYVVIPWRNHGIGPRFETFNMPFLTKYLIPISVPIAYSFHAKSWQTSFLNAGVAYGIAAGRTKFYRDALQSPRNFYWGAGLLGGISSITLNAASVNPPDSAAVKAVGTSGYTLPAIYAGIHIGFSLNSVQLMITVQKEWAMGSFSSAWIYHRGLSLGIGIGLSSFNLAVPSSASTPFGH